MENGKNDYFFFLTLKKESKLRNGFQFPSLTYILLSDRYDRRFMNEFSIHELLKL